MQNHVDYAVKNKVNLQSSLCTPQTDPDVCILFIERDNDKMC